MIGDALRMDIECYAGQRHRNPLFAMAVAGTLTPRIVAGYLSSVRFMIRHTPLHLRRARQRACELGDVALAAHFEAKLAEEIGHDVWADRDLDAVNSFCTTLMPRTSMPFMPAPPMPTKWMCRMACFMLSGLSRVARRRTPRPPRLLFSASVWPSRPCH